MLLSNFNFITIYRPSMVITQGTVLYPPLVDKGLGLTTGL